MQGAIQTILSLTRVLDQHLFYCDTLDVIFQGTYRVQISHHATFYWVRFPRFPAYGKIDTGALQYLLRLKDGWE